MGMFRQLTPPIPNFTMQEQYLRSFSSNMKAWILLVVLLSAANAQTSPTSDPTINRLAKVEIFAFGGIGYAGNTSQAEKDYWVILSRPTAAADFELLFSTGNAQARSYALVGIRSINPDRFKTLTSSLRDSKADVTTESGCIVLHESLGSVLGRIEAGDYAKKSHRSSRVR